MNARSVMLTALLSLAGAGYAGAQMPAPRSHTSGLVLGAYLNGSALKVDGASETDNGGGLSLRVGYGFGQHVTLFAAGTGANIKPSGGDSYALGHFDLGLRYLFGSQARAARPFIQAAFSGRAASQETTAGTIDLGGTGGTGGVGIEYFLSPAFALEGGLDVTVGKFTQGRVDGGGWQDLGSDSYKATSSRLNLGISWHP